MTLNSKELDNISKTLFLFDKFVIFLISLPVKLGLSISPVHLLIILNIFLKIFSQIDTAIKLNCNISYFFKIVYQFN